MDFAGDSSKYKEAYDKCHEIEEESIQMLESKARSSLIPLGMCLAGMVFAVLTTFHITHDLL